MYRGELAISIFATLVFLRYNNINLIAKSKAKREKTVVVLFRLQIPKFVLSMGQNQADNESE